MQGLQQVLGGANHGHKQGMCMIMRQPRQLAVGASDTAKVARQCGKHHIEEIKQSCEGGRLEAWYRCWVRARPRGIC